MVTSDFRPEVEIWPFRACAMKICNKTLIYGWIAKIFAPFRKSGSGNTTLTSDFSPEVEIRPFRACPMINTQYNPYLWPNFPQIFASFRKSGSRNTMVTPDFSPEVEIRPFRARAMHSAIIIGTVRWLWTWTWLWADTTFHRTHF